MKRIILSFILVATLSATLTAQEKYFEWNQSTPNFPNQTANQVTYINFGDARLWGWVEVTITGGYSYRLTTGKYTKRFQIGKNQGTSGHFSQVSEVPTNFGPVGAEWKIGEFEFVNGNLRVPIYHLLTTQNGLNVTVRGMSVIPYDVSNISISPVTILANNETRDNVSFLHGKVGIGTNNPGEGVSPMSDLKLHVNGSITVNSGKKIAVDQNHYSHGYIQYSGTVPKARFLNYGYYGHRFDDNGGTRMVIEQGGNVGIGTTTPDSKLDVAGVITSRSELRSKMSNPAILLDETDVPDKNWHIQVNGGDLKFFEVNDARSSWNQKMVIKSNGNVGIGTTNVPSQFKLAVAGKIISEEVTVKLQSTWPDYVFSNDYKLPSLEEVEQQISKNGHLANIPSAAEVKKNGIELGEMNKKLLEKIEELTLYTIQQDKEIKALKKQDSKLEKLEKENQELKDRLSKIEEMLSKK